MIQCTHICNEQDVEEQNISAIQTRLARLDLKNKYLVGNK